LSVSYDEQQLCGWGRFPVARTTVATPQGRDDIASALREQAKRNGGVIGRGTGLSYGDASLNSSGRVIAMGGLNRILGFDVEIGLITCEAGVTLGQIFDLCVPQGWCVPVSPGTARVTVAGCLASDIHGKNHHLVGSFSQHITRAVVLTAQGDVLTCGPDQNAELFWATAGGMGLTGIVIELTLQLQKIETAYLVSRKIATSSLDETFRRLESKENLEAAYSTSWIDSVKRGRKRGRAVLMLGEHAKLTDLPPEKRAAPFAVKRQPPKSLSYDIPSMLLRRPLGLAFNEYVYRHYASTANKPSLAGAGDYFYLLDTYDNWNRLYGGDGFIEYQVVLPPERAYDAVVKLLGVMDAANIVSFFTSIKRLGKTAPGHISFPMPGYAFSVDIPAGGRSTLAALDRCDDITVAAGGRLYLAKDARMRAELFPVMYQRHRKWLDIVRRYDPDGVFASDMSRRLKLTG
jgi:decaprenylphospho-beta-D-ribofuranose 2-oxidase